MRRSSSSWRRCSSRLGGWKATQIKIGDLHPGVPELRADSQYNIDTDFITKHFSIGVDVITVIVESEPEACTRHDIMTTIDRFEWHMRNVPGVQSVLGIGTVWPRSSTPAGTKAASSGGCCPATPRPWPRRSPTSTPARGC